MPIKHVNDVIEYLDQNGETAHNDLRQAIFDSGGTPDHRIFSAILRHPGIKKRNQREEGQRPVVMYSKA